MQIKNVHIIGKRDNPSQIIINGSKIAAVEKYANDIQSQNDQIVINFKDAIAFPGLINSHDHLEFNLFPKLGNKIYDDYVDWGIDIHAKLNDRIEEVKNIPYEIRFKWGLYKNLICGVTTVAHHGNGPVYNYEKLPTVISRYNYLHSIQLEHHWKIKLNLLFNGNPFVIHIGEGKNAKSVNEINEMMKWNLFGKKIIGVHGIALDGKKYLKLKALVWCPDSNIFLYDKTADVGSLKKYIKILFGTDSTLSADWNLWNHLRLAKEINFMSDDELYNSLTTTAAEVWNKKYIGSVTAGKEADLVIANRKELDQWESFYSSNPEDILLILKQGKIVLLDKSLTENKLVINPADYDLIAIGSAQKYIVKGIKELVESIKQFIPLSEFPIQIL